jgi:hypothetical protein
VNKLYPSVVARTEPAMHVRKSFKISYQHYDGSVLNAVVKPITQDDYEVFIKEKGVIIHCTKDENGILSCRLNSNGNPLWVDGISKEVAKEMMDGE